MKSDLNGLLNQFLTSFQATLTEELPEMKEALLKSARHTVVDNSSNLRRWMPQLASGELTRDDLDFLIKAQLDLTRLNALADVGLGVARLDALRKSLVSTLISSMFKTIGV